MLKLIYFLNAILCLSLLSSCQRIQSGADREFQVRSDWKYLNNLHVCWSRSRLEMQRISKLLASQPLARNQQRELVDLVANVQKHAESESKVPRDPDGVWTFSGRGSLYGLIYARDLSGYWIVSVLEPSSGKRVIIELNQYVDVREGIIIDGKSP